MKVLTQNTVDRMLACRAILGKDYVSKDELLSALNQIGINGINGQLRYDLKTPEGQYLINPALYSPGTIVKPQVNSISMPKKSTQVQETVIAMAAPAILPVQQKTVGLNAGENFDAAGLIPRLDQNFVAYGVYNKIKKIIKSKRFFPVYLTGPTGVGKSSLVKHICASAGMKFARVVITKDTTDEDLFGRMTLVDGNLKFVDGVMTLAANMGFTIVLDEISAGDPRNLFGLYTILEGDRHFIKDANKFVQPVQGFNIVCTDNTLGRGDDSGAYVGTNILNEAMLDRFPIALYQDYPSESDEYQILLKRMESNGDSPELPENAKFAASVAKWAGMIRASKKAGALDDVISTRRTLVIMDHFSIFGREMEAVKDACTRFGEATASAFVDYYTKLNGDSEQAAQPAEVTPAVDENINSPTPF